MSIQAKLDKEPPYKLLACDGGGIRGIISIEILAKIEDELRVSSGNGKLVLADYFDYVAGTSTGAIIATLVSLGFSVAEIRAFYLESGAEMFEKAAFWERWFWKFRPQRLEEMLKCVLSQKTGQPVPTLGSAELRTLLMFVLRNATTDSPWPISNNPRAKYNDLAARGDDSNLHLPLWQLVRASTAAPTYFAPEIITINPRHPKKFIFVDGGVTMYNNPAFQLFLMATSEPYRLGWRTGENEMLIVSIGTGTSAGAKATLRVEDMTLLFNASNIPSALMAAALHEQDFLCRIFGRCLAGDPIDREVSDVIRQGIPGLPKLFTYARYNPDLSREGLAALGLNQIRPEHVQQMDSVAYIKELQEVGRAAAQRFVDTKLQFVGFPP
jgi:patatin-like phospholipase/acyl hydrolase